MTEDLDRSGHAGTVAFDLDGTLADYEGGWEKYSAFPGDMLPGVVTALGRLTEAGFKVGVFSTRSKSVVMSWLKRWSLAPFVSWVNVNPDNPPHTSTKPFYTHYIGDRAIRFDGDMAEIVDEILSGGFVPWQKAMAGKFVCEADGCVDSARVSFDLCGGAIVRRFCEHHARVYRDGLTDLRSFDGEVPEHGDSVSILEGSV